MAEADLAWLSAGGRLLVGRPYGLRPSHTQGLADCLESAEVRELLVEVAAAAAAAAWRVWMGLV
jgi:hypothetical protein